MKSKLVKLLLGLGTAAMLLSGCYKKEIAELHNTHDADMAKIREGLTSVQSSVQTTVNNLEAAKSALEIEISNLEQKIKDASGRSDEFASELKTLKEKLTGCENELVEVKKSLERIAGLDIDKKLEELNILIENAGKMEGRILTLEENQALILSSYATLAKVEEIVNGAFSEFVANDFYANLEKYKATILAWFTQDLSEQMKAALDTAFNNYYTIARTDELLDELRDDIYDEMDDVCGEMGQDLEALKDSIDIHRGEIDALKLSVKNLEGEVVDIIKEAIENGEFEEAFGQLLSKLTSDVTALQTSIGTLQSDVEELKTAVSGIKTTIGEGSLTTTSQNLIGAINELKGRIDAVVDPTGKIASDIAAVKAEADSLAEVTKALESKYSSASDKSDSLANVTKVIEENYAALLFTVDSLNNAVNTRLASIEALKGVSLVYVPDYDDGKASLYIDDPRAEELSGSLTMNFRVYSEKEIDGDWVEESVKGHFIGTQTRAASGLEATPESASYENGVLSVTFSYSQFGEIYETYRAVAVSAVVGDIAASTYVPIYVQPYLSVEPGETTFYFTYEAGEKRTITVSAAPGTEWSVAVTGDAGVLVNGETELTGLTGTRTIEVTTSEISSRASGSIIVSGAGIEYVYNVVREQEYNFQLTNSSNRYVTADGSNIIVRSWDDEDANFRLYDSNTGARIQSGVTVSVVSGSDWLSVRWSNNRLYISVDEFNFRRGQYNWTRSGSFSVEYDGQVQVFSVTQYNYWGPWWD